jgi:hypothetical protein
MHCCNSPLAKGGRGIVCIRINRELFILLKEVNLEICFELKQRFVKIIMVFSIPPAPFSKGEYGSRKVTVISEERITDLGLSE